MDNGTNIPTDTPHLSCVRGIAIIVGDDRWRAAAAKLVEAEGFRALFCEQSADALRLAKEHRPDVLLIDTEFRGDWGGLLRILHRCPDTRSIVPVVILPEDWQRQTSLRILAREAFASVVRPLNREAFCEIFRRAVEQSGKLKLEHEKTAPRPKSATRHVIGNNSVLARRTACPFHPEPVPLDRFMLRTGRIQTETSFFDIPIYKSATKGAHFVNFHLLHVAVCPKCHFATNNPAYFYDPGDRKTEPHNHTAGTRDAIIGELEKRKALMAGASPNFYNEKRTFNDGVLSHELAIACSRTLFECNKYTLPIELVRLGNLHLRHAHLLETARAGAGRIDPQYEAAATALKHAFSVVERPALFKAAYQLVAISIYLGDDKSAYQYIARMSDLEREAAMEPSDLSALQRYLARCRSAWEDRTMWRRPDPRMMAA